VGVARLPLTWVRRVHFSPVGPEPLPVPADIVFAITVFAFPALFQVAILQNYTVDDNRFFQGLLEHNHRWTQMNTDEEGPRRVTATPRPPWSHPQAIWWPTG